jgi:opacity protein-like surface antigen
MKKLFLALIVVALALLGTVQAADHYNAGTIVIYESHTSIVYKWTMTVPAGGDSTGSWHSRPMFIADGNAVDGYVMAVGTGTAGTEDANILYHFGYDNRTTWYSAVTPADLDAVGATALHDTIGINSGTNTHEFHNGRWLVVEYDGQTGNESNRLFTFVMHLTKDATVTDNAGGYVKLGRYATKSETNP